MTPQERRDVEQALVVAEKLNDAAVSLPIKPTARIQFIAHLICALGLAEANKIPYATTSSTLRKIYDEMRGTARRQKQKPKLRVIDK